MARDARTRERRCVNSSGSIKAVVEQGSSFPNRHVFSRFASPNGHRSSPNCKTNGHRHCQRPSPAVGVGTVPLPVNLHRPTALFAEWLGSCVGFHVGTLSEPFLGICKSTTPLRLRSSSPWGAAGLWPICSAHNFHRRSKQHPQHQLQASPCSW